MGSGIKWVASQYGCASSAEICAGTVKLRARWRNLTKDQSVPNSQMYEAWVNDRRLKKFFGSIPEAQRAAEEWAYKALSDGVVTLSKHLHPDKDEQFHTSIKPF